MRVGRSPKRYCGRYCSLSLPRYCLTAISSVSAVFAVSAAVFAVAAAVCAVVAAGCLVVHRSAQLLVLKHYFVAASYSLVRPPIILAVKVWRCC